MKTRVHRSMMILPVHIPRFVEKAHLRGADAIVLDLEDAVPMDLKAKARTMVRDAVAMVGRGGADVFVRVNNDPDLLLQDLDAAVLPNVHGIFVPKVESAKDVTYIGHRVSELELEKDMHPGQVVLSLHVESPRGVLRMQEIVSASSRVESVSLGMDDYRLELGVEPSEDGIEVLFALAIMVNACKAEGIMPLGVLGTVARVRDMDGFERAAERARQLGCEGAYCVHPDQVAVLNRVFTPSPQVVDHANRVVSAFEEGTRSGRAAINLDGGMVDTPIYKRAKLVLERTAFIREMELRKQRAISELAQA